MRFDAYAALAGIKAERRTENARSNNAEACDNGDTCDTCDTAAANSPHVAHVAHVARGCVPEKPATPDPADDAATLSEHLRLHGPSSYGAVASDLGWSPSRAWRAEAALQAGGRIGHDRLGQAALK